MAIKLGQRHFDIRTSLFPALSLTIITILVAAYALRLSGNLINLSWPGKQIIPSILHERGELTSDFLSSSSVNSPYHISAKIFSYILPDQWNELLATFGTASFLLKILILWLSVILLVKSWRLLIEKCNLIDKKYLHAYTASAYIAFSFLLPAVYQKGNSGVIKSLLHGAQVGGWDYPLHDSLNPSGLSFGLLLIALLLGLSSQIRGNALRATSMTGTLFLASLIHPVVPLLSVPYYLFLSIASRMDWSIDIFFLKRAALSLLGCAGGVATLLYLYPQSDLNALDYFRIYVVERHPHHYLPSAYMDGIKAKIFINFAFTGILAFAVFRVKASWWPIKLYVACLLYLFATHSIQYVFVEQLKNPLFISLGVSRLSGLYNFTYLLLLTLFTTILLASSRLNEHVVQLHDFALNFFVRLSSKPIARFGPIIFLVCIVISFWRIQNNQLALFESQPERAIRAAFNTHLPSSNYEVLFNVTLYNPREVGGLPVFSDAYFPFTKGAILSWEKRQSLSKDFFICLKETRAPNSCSTTLSDYRNLFLLSSDPDLDGDISFDVDTTAGHIYAYRLL